ncbi:hypothetical protein LR004_00145 [Candidatus Gracilibacteria bacterium]|nr:hypothetical protein [Candidatus Gracilibacteria bacterium]
MNGLETIWERGGDSIVQKHSDKVIKLYKSKLKQSDLDFYQGMQTRVSEQIFEITDLDSKYVKTPWNKINKISVKTLKNNSTLLTYCHIDTKEKGYVSEVKYIEGKDLSHYMSFCSILELYEKITHELEQITKMNLRQSGINEPATQIDMINIKVTGFSDGVLEIIITDICCDIYDFSSENNPDFYNSRVAV